jgi:hypothetical protein
MNFKNTQENEYSQNVKNNKKITLQKSWLAGVHDKNGHLMTGTEIMFIVPHMGKLYAGNSLWMESDPNISKACQIFVLESPEDDWKLDYQFAENNLRVSSLKSITFSTDSKGNSINPVSILLANPLDFNGSIEVYIHDDDNGIWVKNILGSAQKLASIRCITLYRDTITGVDRVFAGSDPLGTFSGTYDPSLPGKINWEKTPEFPTPEAERVMAMTVCNKKFHCATSRHIYVRTDGPSPSWSEVYHFPQTNWLKGIRGLTSIPNPTGQGESLLFTVRNKVHRLDPLRNYEETIELDLNDFLSKKWGLQVDYVLSAYSEFLPFNDPISGEDCLLFGFQARYHRSVFETESPPKIRVCSMLERGEYYDASGRYFMRHVKDGNISYEYVDVTDPHLDPEPMLVAVRTITQSPFKGEEGRVLYLGGFDCNWIKVHNTGWIYRGEY